MLQRAAGEPALGRLRTRVAKVGCVELQRRRLHESLFATIVNGRLFIIFLTDPLVLFIDELPPYLEYAVAVLGNADLSVVTTAALANLEFEIAS